MMRKLLSLMKMEYLLKRMSFDVLDVRDFVDHDAAHLGRIDEWGKPEVVHVLDVLGFVFR